MVDWIDDPTPEGLMPEEPAARDASRPTRPGWALAAAGAALVGGASIVACLLAIRLELDGFGRPRDSTPRGGYLALLWWGVAAGIVIPSTLAWKGLGSRWPVVAVLMLVTVGVGWFVLGV